jgi:hypothetical protein
MDRAGEFMTHGEVLKTLLAARDQLGLPSVDAVGHRAVHGSPDHFGIEVVNRGVLED